MCNKGTFILTWKLALPNLKIINQSWIYIINNTYINVWSTLKAVQNAYTMENNHKYIKWLFG